MAEDLIISRGNIGTHNMHVADGETPTADWASILARNTGIIRGNFQQHLMVTNADEIVDDLDDQLTLQGGTSVPMTVAEWKFPYPSLGTYGRLSCTIFGEYGFGFLGVQPTMGIVLQILTAASTELWSGTTEFSAPLTNTATRVHVDWDTSGGWLEGHEDDPLVFKLIKGGPNTDPFFTYTRCDVYFFTLYCSSLPF